MAKQDKTPIMEDIAELLTVHSLLNAVTNLRMVPHLGTRKIEPPPLPSNSNSRNLTAKTNLGNKKDLPATFNNQIGL